MSDETTELREELTERGIEWKSEPEDYGEQTIWQTPSGTWCYYSDNFSRIAESSLTIHGITPEQVIVATLGRPRAKSHPYGYERDTGAFDCTRCECGCINDISAKYCNDCGGEIKIDMYAEKEIYHCPRHLVFAEKHDDGSLEFDGKRYIAATLGSEREKQLEKLVQKALDEGHIDEWWYEDARKLGLEANY